MAVVAQAVQKLMVEVEELILEAVVEGLKGSKPVVVEEGEEEEVRLRGLVALEMGLLVVEERFPTVFVRMEVGSEVSCQLEVAVLVFH